jgi:SPOR domain
VAPLRRAEPRIIVIDPIAPAATSAFNFRRKAERTRPASEPVIAPAAEVAAPGFSPTVSRPPAAPQVEAAAAAVPTAAAGPAPSAEPRQAMASEETIAAPLVTPPDPAPAFADPSAAIVAMSGDRLSGIDRLLAKADELPVPPPPQPQYELPAKPKPAERAAPSKAPAKAAVDPNKLAAARKLAEAKRAARDEAERAAIGLAGTHWVQLAGGTHADRMASEFARLAAKSSLLRRRGGAVTGGKDYFRLLTGPFDSKAAAQAFVNQLATDGVRGFSWSRTPAGLRIEKLGAR